MQMQDEETELKKERLDRTNLVEQGNQQVDANLVGCFAGSASPSSTGWLVTHAKDRLELELDFSFSLIHLGFQRFMATYQSQELAWNFISTRWEPIHKIGTKEGVYAYMHMEMLPTLLMQSTESDVMQLSST